MDTCSALQKQLDVIGKQMYTTLHYLNHKHDYLAFEGQTRLPDHDKVPIHADDTVTFETTKRQLATELVAAVKDFQTTVDQLPGLDISESQQKAEIMRLEGRLSTIEDQRRSALQARALSQQSLEKMIIALASSVQDIR